MLREFQARYPAIDLQQKEANMAGLMQDLEEGMLDVAFVRLPCESSKSFNLKLIDEEPMVIAVHRDHPLAARDTLTLQALRDVPPILFPQDVAPGLYELVFNACLRAGINMKTKRQASQISSSLSMVAAGFGFALVPESLTSLSLPGVTFHSLSGQELKTDIALAWRKFERSPAVKRFVEML